MGGAEGRGGVHRTGLGEFRSGNLDSLPKDEKLSSCQRQWFRPVVLVVQQGPKGKRSDPARRNGPVYRETKGWVLEKSPFFHKTIYQSFPMLTFSDTCRVLGGFSAFHGVCGRVRRSQKTVVLTSMGSDTRLRGTRTRPLSVRHREPGLLESQIIPLGLSHPSLVCVLFWVVYVRPVSLLRIPTTLDCQHDVGMSGRRDLDGVDPSEDLRGSPTFSSRGQMTTKGTI